MADSLPEIEVLGVVSRHPERDSPHRDVQVERGGWSGRRLLGAAGAVVAAIVVVGVGLSDSGGPERRSVPDELIVTETTRPPTPAELSNRAATLMFGVGSYLQRQWHLDPARVRTREVSSETMEASLDCGGRTLTATVRSRPFLENMILGDEDVTWMRLGADGLSEVSLARQSEGFHTGSIYDRGHLLFSVNGRDEYFNHPLERQNVQRALNIGGGVLAGCPPLPD